jgi:predicted CoA-binding protein
VVPDNEMLGKKAITSLQDCGYDVETITIEKPSHDQLVKYRICMG